MIREYQTKELDIMYTADSNTISEWDIKSEKAWDYGYKLGIKGQPAEKWRTSFVNLATQAGLGYKAGLMTRKASAKCEI